MVWLRLYFVNQKLKNCCNEFTILNSHISGTIRPYYILIGSTGSHGWEYHFASLWLSEIPTPSDTTHQTLQNSQTLQQFLRSLYLKALGDQLHFQHLVGALSPLTSPDPSLDIVLEQPAHTTGTTTDTGSASMPAPSFLRHLPNRLIDNPVDVALRVEDWRQGVPIEQYHHLRHVNQVG